MAVKRRALHRNYAEIVDLLCCSTEEMDGVRNVRLFFFLPDIVSPFDRL
jgi:hypothetical protein